MTNEERIKFDTTTHKTIIGQRLLVGTAAVLGGVLLYQVWLGAQGAKMAEFLVEAWLYFMAIGVLGVNAAQYGVQRFSSKEYKEADERGKATGAASALVLSETAKDAQAARGLTTKERPAMVINAEDQSTVKVEPAVATEPRAPRVPRPKPPTEPDLYADDERGE